MKKILPLVALLSISLTLPAQAQVFYTGYFVTGLMPQRGVLEDVVSYGIGAEYIAGMVLGQGLGAHVNLGYTRMQTEGGGDAIHYIPFKMSMFKTFRPWVVEGRLGLASFLDDGYTNSFLTELEAGLEAGNLFIGVGGGSFYHMGTGGRLNNETGSSSGYLQARLRLRLNARVMQ